MLMLYLGGAGRYNGIMKWLKRYRKRRLLGVVALVALVVGAICLNPASYEAAWEPAEAGVEAEGAASGGGEAGGDVTGEADGPLATEILERLEVKGRAPKTGYDREEFYSDWPVIDGCNLRQRIIKREFGEAAVLDSENRCTVVAGEYDEPYTGEHKVFREREEISEGVQIDHIVALSDAWQKGGAVFGCGNAARNCDRSVEFDCGGCGGEPAEVGWRCGDLAAGEQSISVSIRGAADCGEI